VVDALRVVVVGETLASDPCGWSAPSSRLYYDTALSTSEYVFAALREFVLTSQVLFGSDFPYVSPGVLMAEKASLEHSRVLDDTARAAIDRGNALELFPRFAPVAV
jgi:6-methylsalicylate decarboxylase